MLFSVVIPTYNRAALLHSALESVFTQEFKDFEVIVVDDGSTDNTNAVVAKWGNQVQFLRTKNIGPGPARNLGIERARADYVALLDSDDLWFPWTLEIFAKLIHRYHQPAILAAKLIRFGFDLDLAKIQKSSLCAEVFDDYLASHRKAYFVGAGMSVLRREEFLKTGGYTEQRINAEDHDLILRMGETRGFVQVIEPVTLGWRLHASSETQELTRTTKGAFYLIEQERRGAYPGGAARALARWEIITRHTRPVTLECLRRGWHREAWAVYRATYDWNKTLGKYKYLIGFPGLAIAFFYQPRIPTRLHSFPGEGLN